MIRRTIHPTWLPRVRLYSRPFQVWARWMLWSFHYSIKTPYPDPATKQAKL